MSEFKNVIPMRVPKIGNTGQQPMFDATQTTEKKCECGSEYFDKTYRVGMISKLAPGNKLQQDIPAEATIYICHACGKVLKSLGNNEGE
jgi:hypothetical protein